MSNLPGKKREKNSFQPVHTFSIFPQFAQHHQLWTCSRTSYLVWTVPLRCTIHLFSLQLTRWIILRSDKGFCSKRCLWNRGNVQAFFIVRLFGHNTGNLMNMLADGAPQEAGVSEQRHRGRGEGGGVLATSGLNQTSIRTLPSACMYCQVCACWFNQPLLQSATGHWTFVQTRPKNRTCQTGVCAAVFCWCRQSRLNFFFPYRWDLVPSVRCVNPSPSQPFTWARVLSHLIFFSTLDGLKRPLFIFTPLTAAPCLSHSLPHVSLPIQSVSHRIHLLVSPSPLSNHPLCSEPRSCSFSFFLFAALPSCFSPPVFPAALFVFHVSSDLPCL